MTATDEQPALTDRQFDIYAYIVGHWGANCGSYPTIREICDKFGISSPNGVMCHLIALEKKGYISLEDKKSRSIRVVGLAGQIESIADKFLSQVRKIPRAS